MARAGGAGETSGGGGGGGETRRDEEEEESWLSSPCFFFVITLHVPRRNPKEGLAFLGDIHIFCYKHVKRKGEIISIILDKIVRWTQMSIPKPFPAPVSHAIGWDVCKWILFTIMHIFTMKN